MVDKNLVVYFLGRIQLDSCGRLLTEYQNQHGTFLENNLHTLLLLVQQHMDYNLHYLHRRSYQPHMYDMKFVLFH